MLQIQDRSLMIFHTNSFVEPYLQLLDKFNDDLRSFIFSSQKLHPRKSWVIVNNHKNVSFPIESLHSHRSTQIHVKGMENFYNGVGRLGF